VTLQLRSPDDVKRLFSALGELPSPQVDLSVSDVDQLALLGGGNPLDDIDPGSFALSLLVALSIGWVAVRAYERNGKSMGWALTWALFGYLSPLPTLGFSYYRDVR
jgi:hypothetical protein